MAKEKQLHKRHISTTDTHIMLKKGIVIYALFVFISFVLVSLSAYTAYNIAVANTNKHRLNRIETIYASIHLDDSYRVNRSNLFGDKRIYSWDKGRSYASSVEYGRNDTVANTFADVKSRVEAAGFRQVDDVYGGVARQLHFKNSDGEYVRVSVVPKAWQDAIMYGTTAPETLQTTADDTVSASPVYVTIKVNLDDNNE